MDARARAASPSRADGAEPARPRGTVARQLDDRDAARREQAHELAQVALDRLTGRQVLQDEQRRRGSPRRPSRAGRRPQARANSAPEPGSQRPRLLDHRRRHIESDGPPEARRERPGQAADAAAEVEREPVLDGPAERRRVGEQLADRRPRRSRRTRRRPSRPCCVLGRGEHGPERVDPAPVFPGGAVPIARIRHERGAGLVRTRSARRRDPPRVTSEIRAEAARRSPSWPRPSTSPLADMAALVDAGIEVVGENKAQDLERKHAEYGDAFRWHFIGHLQSNKVKVVNRICELVHSLVVRLRRAPARRSRPSSRSTSRASRPSPGSCRMSWTMSSPPHPTCAA